MAALPKRWVQPLGVQGLGFRGFRVWGLGFRVKGLRFKGFWGLGFRVRDLKVRIWVGGFRV